MRLLVTRPEPDATRTAERLRALGHEALVDPLLTITFTPPPNGLPKPAAILITSQNAVRALGLWPDAAQWRGVPVFVAGPATARATAALGFTDVRAGAQDAGTLATRVIADLAPGAGPLIYPAARDRAGALDETLIAAGYDVRTIEAYRAEEASALNEAARPALVDGKLDGVLLYSRRTAGVFRDLAVKVWAGSGPRPLTYFVISEQIAEVLAGLPGKVHIAEHPDEDSLLRLIPSAR
jgi:uroporphyrinogen-III synthase